MNILYALFNPDGTIKGQPYWIAAGLLIITAALMQFLGYWFVINSEDLGGMMRGSIFSLLLWLLIYPYFCLYGKRLRDMGHPATWFILIIFLYAIANWIVQMAVSMPAMMGEMETMIDRMGDMQPNEDGEVTDFSEMMSAQVEMQKSMTKQLMWPTLIGSAFVSAIFSGVLGSFKSKDEDNPYKSDATLFE